MPLNLPPERDLPDADQMLSRIIASEDARSGGKILPIWRRRPVAAVGSLVAGVAVICAAVGVLVMPRQGPSETAPLPAASAPRSETPAPTTPAKTSVPIPTLSPKYDDPYPRSGSTDAPEPPTHRPSPTKAPSPEATEPETPNPSPKPHDDATPLPDDVPQKGEPPPEDPSPRGKQDNGPGDDDSDLGCEDCGGP